MNELTLKNPHKLGERDEKYGQTYWAYSNESHLPVKFNLMSGSVSDGDEITFDEQTVREGKKGEYMQLKKVRVRGATQGTTLVQASHNNQSNEDRARWAITSAIQFAGSETSINDIESSAKTFFAMVDKINVPKEVVTREQTVTNEEVEEPINLDDIPF